MITLISFFVVLLGAFNWLSIGLMQYDFVAGIFGTQSSFLSRTIYILVGFAAIWLIVTTFLQKGRIKINDNGFKKMGKKNQENQYMATEYENEYGNRGRNNEPYDQNHIYPSHYSERQDNQRHPKSPFEN